MKILITGGAGFIGSHVADAYVKAGHRVTVLDNLSTGLRKNVNPKALFIQADICDGKAADKIVRKIRPDVINHHAAAANFAECVRNPASAFAANTLGTIHLLMGAGKVGVRKFIFSSTAAVYGNPKHFPVKETAPANPTSSYGFSKILAEEAIRLFSRQQGFAFSIFRYANVFGPRQSPSGEAGVFAIFSSRMRRGLYPTIFGDGTKTRDYVYVADVVRANVLALTKGNNATLNLGTGKETSDRAVYDSVAAALQFHKTPRFAAVRPGEIIRSALDASRAKKILGWKPRYTVSQGVQEMLEDSN